MNMIIHPHIETHYESIYCTVLHTNVYIDDIWNAGIFLCSAVKNKIKYITFNILLAINMKNYINKYIDFIDAYI